MNTKLVTAYYPVHNGPPFWGKENRHRWYKHSIASICNTGVPVVCYTDAGESYDELLQIKNERQLDNLEIKIYDIASNPFQERMYRVRAEGNPDLYNNYLHPFYKMPFSIYWMKWNFLKMEYEEDTYIYWIDGGLSTDGVFPKRGNDYADEDGFDIRYAEMGNFYTDHEFKFHSFKKIFNPDLITKINNFVGDKVLNLCRQDQTDNDFYTLEDKLNVPIKGKVAQANKYPVGAIFGGNSPYLMEYINKFNEVADQILSIGDYACTEQEIMGYIHAEHPEWFADWRFHDFYHEDWQIMNDHVLTPYRTLFPNNTSFSSFFLDPINNEST
jgi:hypothetical protein